MTQAHLLRPNARRATSSQTRGRRVVLPLALLGALLTLLLAGCGTQAGDWRLIGPETGAHVYTIVADPNIAGLVYAGADDGGVYRGLADQQGGVASGVGIPQTATITSLLPDPQRAGVIFAGTSAGLYRSDNYGDQWSAYGSGLPTGRAAVALASTPDDATLLAGIDHGGLYRSVNDGATWTAATSGLPAQATPVALTWDAADHLWLLGLVATSATPLFASADGGQSWEPRATGLPAGAQVNALATLGDSSATPTLFAATTQGLFTSVNAGQSWSHVGGGLPQGSALALAMLKQQPTWVYAAISSAVYRSTDGGAQWTLVAPGLTSEVQGLAVTEGKHSGPVVYAAIGQVARYPSGAPAGGGIPSGLLIGLIALALIISGYVISRRMRRFGYAMGAMRNESNTGRAADAAARWSNRADASSGGERDRAAGSQRANGEQTDAGHVVAPTEPTSPTKTGAPTDESKATQNGHGKPKRRR